MIDRIEEGKVSKGGVNPDPPNCPRPDPPKGQSPHVELKRQSFDMGDHVECDICGKDWTNDQSGAKGGFLLLSKGICPDCSSRMKERLTQYNELEHIRDTQHKDETFKQACLRWRHGNNTVEIITFGRDDGQ